MLQRIILIHSARFAFADVDLRRDVFFLGDNGSGKTSFIRAIHFLYSGDTRSVGIPADKENFKSYYFPYDNSCIVYIFEDFFIVMYKSGGEIVKYFSYQPFELARIVDASRRLRPIAEIRTYVRQAPYVRAVSVEEYTDILYGKRAKHRRFAIARIGEVRSFLKLYHTVFNIDKAIVDAKSIKQAIFTSLDASEAAAFFDPEAYVQKILHYMSRLKLYRHIERRSDTIDKAAALKTSLLEDERQLKRLSRHIRYRIDFETEQRTQLQEKKATLQEQKEAVRRTLNLYVTRKKRCTERTQERAGRVRSRIAHIKEDVTRFSPQALKEADTQARRKHDLSIRMRELQKHIAKLEAGIENETHILEQRIDQLTRHMEHEIPADCRVQEQESIAHILEEKYRKEEELTQRHEAQSQHHRAKAEALEHAADKLQAKQQAHQEKRHAWRQRRMELDDRMQRYRLERREAIARQRADVQRKRQTLSLETDRNKHTLSYDIEALKQRFQDDMRRFEQEKADTQSAIEEIQTQLHTPEGSLKAFLEERYEGWREELYPLMDLSLLSKPADTLQAEITATPLCGLRFGNAPRTYPDTDTLQRQQESLTQRLHTLNEEFARHKDKYEQQLQHMQRRYDEIEALHAKQQAEIDDALKELEAQEAHLETAVHETFAAALHALNEEERALNAEEEALRKESVMLQQRQEELQKTLRNLHARYTKARRKIEETAKKAIAQQHRHTQICIAKRQEEAKARIAELKAQIRHIGADAMLSTLREELESTEKAYQTALDALRFLEAYKKAQEHIRQLPALERKLSDIETLNRRFSKRMEEKQRRCQEEIERIDAALLRIAHDTELIDKGLERAAQLELFDETKEPCEHFVHALALEYESLYARYTKGMIQLQEAMQRIGSIEGLHTLMDVRIDLSAFETTPFISELGGILGAIGQIHELKKSKLDILKRSDSTDFRNFVENIYTKKLELFANTEERFMSLVQRINRELKEADFGVISDIRIDTSLLHEESIAKQLNRIKEEMASLGALFTEDSLFFDRRDALKHLETLEAMFTRLKKMLRSDRISLVDTVDVSLSFNENGVRRTHVTQIKNESSTGGSMLLKIALATAILNVFIKEAKGVFFLIVDEVSRLHSDNQKRLKAFANTHGFKIAFVTPEPVFADAKHLTYYKFVKHEEGFEAIRLNR